jgi:hypothetical protein
VARLTLSAHVAAVRWCVVYAGRGQIGSAKAADASLTSWIQRGPTIPMPARIDAGYRDPVRAFNYSGKWFQGVGCGSKTIGAQFCAYTQKHLGLIVKPPFHVFFCAYAQQHLGLIRKPPLADVLLGVGGVVRSLSVLTQCVQS